MSTNKTRIGYYDISSTQPLQVAIVLEFDIYQDAIDYVETYAKLLISNNNAWYMYLFSYDNLSYKYYHSGGELQKEVVSFPNTIG